jgi:hypothetical protein
VRLCLATFYGALTREGALNLTAIIWGHGSVSERRITILPVAYPQVLAQVVSAHRMPEAPAARLHLARWDRRQPTDRVDHVGPIRRRQEPRQSRTSL